MGVPGLRDWVFSAKTFASAMLALWIAFRIGLDRPYWAMATVYIVAQPLTGAMRSKAAYRLIGTLIGAIATLVLVPNLVDAPELLAAALALWTGGCVYFALLDRTPRSYLFLLAGYTAALIGFPSVDVPGEVWDIALARVEEIGLGIACTTLIGSVILPRPLGPALSARIDEWLRDAAALTLDVLSGHPDDAAIGLARRKLAGAAVEIDMLATHLAYDTSNLRTATRPITLLYRRVVLLIPVLAGISERLPVLREAGAITPAVAAALRHLADWVGASDAGRLAEAGEVRAEIAAAEPPCGPGLDWNAIRLTGLLERLRELTDLNYDIRVLRLQIATGSTRAPHLAAASAEGTVAIRHRDPLMALYSGAAAVLTVGLVCAFWIGAAWPEGSGAAALAAVACSFFASQDDPAPSIYRLLRAALLGVAIDAVYLFAILPRVHDFEILALVLAPLYLLLGVLASMPSTAGIGGPIAFMSATVLALSSSYQADFAAYANSGLAIVVGLASAAVTMSIVRSVGAHWAAERLLRANRADIAAAAARRGATDRFAFAALMLDRLAMVVPRLAMSRHGTDFAAARALADVRVGWNVVNLQRELGALPRAAQTAVIALLDGVAEYYRRPRPGPARRVLLATIDHALAAVTAEPVAQPRTMLRGISGIRQALFPAAPPYDPMPAPPPPAVRQAA